ncbi:hypothetical protein EDB19DRAFT_1725270, partial [Suillus lakei]
MLHVAAGDFVLRTRFIATYLSTSGCFIAGVILVSEGSFPRACNIRFQRFRLSLLSRPVEKVGSSDGGLSASAGRSSRSLTSPTSSTFSPCSPSPSGTGWLGVLVAGCSGEFERAGKPRLGRSCGMDLSAVGRCREKTFKKRRAENRWGRCEPGDADGRDCCEDYKYLLNMMFTWKKL